MGNPPKRGFKFPRKISYTNWIFKKVVIGVGTAVFKGRKNKELTRESKEAKRWSVT